MIFPAKTQVTVTEVKRSDPRVADVIDSVSKTTQNFGYCTAEEFVHFLEENKIEAESVLQVLREMGFGFVKTVIDDPQTPREVIVDIRPMAAAMLLIYADPQYALRHSVLHYVKLIFLNASWNGGRAFWAHHMILEDTYSAYGHYFSNMKMADAADLSERSQDVAIARAKRHIHAINELVKNEVELTQVYLLTLHLMNAINHTQDFSSVTYHRFYGKDHKASGYNHFWRVANEIIDKIRGPEVPKKSK